MQDTALLVGGAAIVALSAIAGLVGWMVSYRSIREHRAATEQAMRAKDEAAEVLSQEIARLDDHIVALRDLESIRFAQRYMDAKSGLEGRVNELNGKLETVRERRETLQIELERMLASDETRNVETGRLRAELIRAQQESRRLEQILESLSEVGPIPANDVQGELTRRRQVQIEMRGQLDRLSLAGVAREAALGMMREELKSARVEERELERDMEIALSASPVLDGLLGINADVTDRLQELQTRLGEPLRVLAESRQGDRFLRAIGAHPPEVAPLLIEGPENEDESPETATATQTVTEMATLTTPLPLAPSGNGVGA